MTNATIRQLSPLQISPQMRPAYILIGLWVLSMISVPIFRWTFGDEAIIWGVNITTIIQAIAIFSILSGKWGVKRTALSTALAVFATWAIEATGTATGFPFGHYDYTQSLQPQLLDVPIIVPLAWYMMLPCAWAVAAIITNRVGGFRFLIVTMLAMTAWDLFLDPQMVEWNLWTWDFPGMYFGIPLVNYAGWLLTAGVVTLLVRPTEMPVYPLFTVYVIVWILQTIGQLFFWNLIGPAVFGFIGMGIFIGLSAYRIKRTA